MDRCLICGACALFVEGKGYEWLCVCPTCRENAIWGAAPANREDARVGAAVGQLPEGGKVRRIGPHSGGGPTNRWHVFVGMGSWDNGPELLPLLVAAGLVEP